MEKNYFIGLDMGTESVGWAVTDEDYNLLKARGHDMWGSYLFDEAQTAAGRRGFRTARRRLTRVRQRINLLQSLFAEEMAKCQRYLRTYDVVWATAQSTASEYLQIQAVYGPMAGVPTITVGSIANFGGTEQPGLSVVSMQKSENAWWIVRLNQSVSANTMLQLKDVFLEAPI